MGNNQQLPRNDIQRPSPISVNDSSNPFTWNLKFASRIVDYVVQFCRNKYSINVRWHVQEYLSSSGDDGDDLVDINYAYLDRALIFEVYIFFKYFNIFGYTYIMTNQPIDQPLFDAAILTIYEEYLLVHYTPYLNYELAVAIALFAVYASQSGFSDALYHAVPAIIAKARALAVNNLTNPLQNL